MTLTPATIRLDLKCGRGAIAQGKTCHKGGAIPRRAALAAGLTAGALGGALLFKGSRKAILNAPGRARRAAQQGVTEAVHRATAKPPSMRFPKDGPLGTMRPPSKTERLHKAAQSANREAEQAISKAAQAEIERTVAVASAMHKSGKAARASLRSGMRRHNLTVEKLRRRYEPGYRRPARSGKRGDALLTPRLLDAALGSRSDGPSTAYYRSHPKARRHKVRHQAAINSQPDEVDRRVALTRERRRRGIAGKGGPDISHTSSGGTTLEAPSTNRARNGAGGKARLRKDEAVFTDKKLHAAVKAETKKKFKVYPSAYANAWMVQEYKRRGGSFRGDALDKWFSEKWVRMSGSGRILGPCGDRTESEGKPKCLPESKAQGLTSGQRRTLVARKRHTDPKKNRSGAPVMVSSKTDVWAVGFDADDGKKYTKVVTNPETGRKNRVRYGAQGYRIAPGTSKGDRYCSRSFGDMKSHGKDCSGPDRNTPLCLSRAKWRCSGKSSR